MGDLCYQSMSILNSSFSEKLLLGDFSERIEGIRYLMEFVWHVFA